MKINKLECPNCNHSEYFPYGSDYVCRHCNNHFKGRDNWHSYAIKRGNK